MKTGTKYRPDLDEKAFDLAGTLFPLWASKEVIKSMTDVDYIEFFLKFTSKLHGSMADFEAYKHEVWCRNYE